MYGIHINKGKRATTLDAMEEDLSKFSIKSCQIFVSIQRYTIFKPINIGDLNAVKNYIKNNKIRLYIHSSYTTIAIWNGNIEKHKRGLKLLIGQMKIAKKIGAKGLVLHLPKKSYSHVTDVLDRCKNEINKTKFKLLLEHPTFKSDDDCSYEMPFQLNRLTKYINKIGLKKWGYTIDTAHLWSSITENNRNAGYNIETYMGAQKWLNALDKETRNRIKLLHLNGSHNLHSSNKDKHAIPIYGTDSGKTDYMWGKLNKNSNTSGKRKKLKNTGLCRFVKFAKSKKITIIIERNVGTDAQLMKSLEVIYSLLN